MRALRPRERRRLTQVCWTFTWLAAVLGLTLGLSGGTVDRLPYDDFTEPARPFWTSEQLGVVPFALPGELTNGEHVTLHVFLKAARLNGTILLRGMAWAESTDAVYYHDYHAEFLRQPGIIVNETTQPPRYLFLRGHTSGKEHNFRTEATTPEHDWPHNIVRPLTFSLVFNETNMPDEDVFQLRVANWRKFYEFGLSDLLSITDRLAASDAPLPLYDEDRTSFFMAVSPFFGVSAEVAAQMAYQHMAHHMRIGFRGYLLYVTRDYLDAFMEHPQLSQWAAERKLCLILWDSARIPRIVIGDSWGNNSTRMADRSDMTERIYAYQSTVYAHALLNLWTGTRNNYVALFDMDEYMVIDPRGKRIDDLGRECWPDYAEIHLHRQGTTCEDAEDGCSVAKNPGRWFNVTDGLSHPIQKFTQLSGGTGMLKAIIMPGSTHSMHVHDSIPNEGESYAPWVQDRPECAAYLLHVTSLWWERGNKDGRQDAKWLWMYESDNSTNSNGQAKRTTSNYRRQQTKDAAARLAL